MGHAAMEAGSGRRIKPPGTNGHRPVRVVAVAVLTLLSLHTWIGEAAAHRGDQTYLYLEIGDTVAARLHMPFIDVEAALGIDLDADDPGETRTRIQANRPALEAYAQSVVDFSGPDGTLTMTPIGVDRVGERSDYVEVAFDVDGLSDLQAFDLRLEPFFDEIDDRDALLLISNDLERGVIDNESEHLLRFTPGNRTQRVDLGDTSQWTNFTASIGAGVDHIRTGPDHLLFLAALLVPSVLIWRGAWVPARSFGSSLWRLTKILSMFTLAHSVTFTLAGIGALPSPGSKLTETVIALSIAAAALHTLRPVLAEREWLICLAFGLFHGFGFASLVAELEVSTSTQLISLLGRNVGIEIGQVVVAALVFPALYVLRVLPLYGRLLVISSIGLTAMSMSWMIERIFEVNLRVNRAANLVLDFPRVLVFVAVFTAISVALRLRHDALRQPLQEVEEPLAAQRWTDR